MFQHPLTTVCCSITLVVTLQGLLSATALGLLSATALAPNPHIRHSCALCPGAGAGPAGRDVPARGPG